MHGMTENDVDMADVADAADGQEQESENDVEMQYE